MGERERNINASVHCPFSLNKCFTNLFCVLGVVWGKRATTHIWSSEDAFCKLVLPHHVNSRTKLGSFPGLVANDAEPPHSPLSPFYAVTGFIPWNVLPTFEGYSSYLNFPNHRHVQRFISMKSLDTITLTISFPLDVYPDSMPTSTAVFFPLLVIVEIVRN